MPSDLAPISRSLMGLLVALPASLLLAGSAGAAPRSACATAGSDNPSRFLLSTLTTGEQIQCQNLLFTLGDPSELKAQDDGRGFMYLEWNPLAANGLEPDPSDPVNYENDIFSLGVQFSPSRTRSSSSGFSYELAVSNTPNSPFYTLETAQLDSIITQRSSGSPTSSVTMLIRDPLALPPVGTLLSTRLDPQPWIPLDTPQRTRITLTNTWTLGTFSNLSSFRNSFTLIDPPAEAAPGPLPWTGAAAGLAISRRLRRRLKLSAQPS